MMDGGLDPWRDDQKICPQCPEVSQRQMQDFLNIIDWYPHLPTAILNKTSTRQKYLVAFDCASWHKEEDVFPLQRCQLKDISATVPECGVGRSIEEYTVPCPHNINLYLQTRHYGKKEDWMHPLPQAMFKR